MQLLHVTAFWFRLARNIPFDLFLYDHIEYKIRGISALESALAARVLVRLSAIISPDDDKAPANAFNGNCRQLLHCGGNVDLSVKGSAEYCSI